MLTREPCGSNMRVSMNRLALWMGVAFAAGGCATSSSGSRGSGTSPPAVRADETAPPNRAASRETVVGVAQGLVGKTRIQLGRKRYPDDSTGLVRAAFDQVGIDLFSNARPGDNGVAAIYRFAEARGRIYTGGRPVAGDLVFFHDTYDRHRNSNLTHVGLVEKVEDDRTVWIIHRVRRGVVRYRMNLDKPDLRIDKSGRVLNDYLRHGTPGRRDVLTAQLFTAYATVLPIEGSPPRTAVIDPKAAQHWTSASAY